MLAKVIGQGAQFTSIAADQGNLRAGYGEHRGHRGAKSARERPDLDVSPVGVIGRVERLSRYLERATQKTFTQYKLTAGEYDVLAALRRTGPPHRLSPTELFSTMIVSSGAMTNRLDHLERAGWVERLRDPDDRRGVLVQLTPQGRSLIDDAVVAHVANERRLLSVLSAPERETLADLLRKLLLWFDEHAPAQ
jgi:DNA-binding MarR family transcriptional regulator